MNKLKLICISLLFAATYGCSEYENIYENDPAIYFAYDVALPDSETMQKDSLNHSFFVLKSSALRDTVWIMVNTMGRTEDYDRPFVIVQSNSGQADAAVAGTHYLPFDDAGIKRFFTVEANKAQALIPVVLLRHSSLALNRVRLELTVVGNEYFRPGIENFRTFAVTTSDRAVKPALWDGIWYYYFGEWGSEKMRFVINATGYTQWERIPADMSYINYLSDTVAQAFRDYNQEHPDDPLHEANGDLVTFPF
ncbi:MAG: DUF4843 domain-containing protein [Prevotellaceae bacterium]|jgi:hypothetical protein|nr:DUF4843 domain-containing protein [Prevotellaceae bacterium]